MKQYIIAGIIGALMAGGSVLGIDKYKEYSNPKLHSSAMAQAILADLEDLNKDVTALYEYQQANGMKAKKNVALIVPEDLVKPKKPPVKPLAWSTMGH